VPKFTNDPLFVKRECKMSDDGIYRYFLDIIWDATLPMAAFVGLNPSTADVKQDDPTIRRCRGFAESWGMGGMRMLNLFAFRATDPKVMLAAKDPIGPENHLGILLADVTGPWIACWGTHGSHMERGAKVRRNLHDLQCLGKNRDGSPKHPLYLKADTKLELYGGV
jgi:hypothetical protein